MNTPEVDRLVQLGRGNDPKRIVAIAERFGLHLADDEEIAAARAIAAALISERIASIETFIAMQRLTRSSVFVIKDGGAVTGMLGLFMLRPAGLRALEQGVFDAVNPDWDAVAREGEEVAAGYGWGFAATTEAGGRAAVKTSVALQRELFCGVPAFTRTATPTTRSSDEPRSRKFNAARDSPKWYLEPYQPH